MYISRKFIASSVLSCDLYQSLSAYTAVYSYTAQYMPGILPWYLVHWPSDTLLLWRVTHRGSSGQFFPQNFCQNSEYFWEFLPNFCVKFYPKKRVITTFPTKKARKCDIRDKKTRNCSINRFTTKKAREPLSGKTLSNKNQTQKQFFQSSTKRKTPGL